MYRLILSYIGSYYSRYNLWNEKKQSLGSKSADAVYCSILSSFLTNLAILTHAYISLRLKGVKHNFIFQQQQEKFVSKKIHLKWNILHSFVDVFLAFTQIDRKVMKWISKKLKLLSLYINRSRKIY